MRQRGEARSARLWVSCLPAAHRGLTIEMRLGELVEQIGIQRCGGGLGERASIRWTVATQCHWLVPAVLPGERLAIFGGVAPPRSLALEGFLAVLAMPQLEHGRPF
jgi:hypothetical protein